MGSSNCSTERFMRFDLSLAGRLSKSCYSFVIVLQYQVDLPLLMSLYIANPFATHAPLRCPNNISLPLEGYSPSSLGQHMPTVPHAPRVSCVPSMGCIFNAGNRKQEWRG